MEDKEDKKFIIPCECGCSISKFQIADWGDGDLWLGYYQLNGRKSLWDRIKIATKIILGKQVLIGDTVIKSKYKEDFKEFVKNW